MLSVTVHVVEPPDVSAPSEQVSEVNDGIPTSEIDAVLVTPERAAVNVPVLSVANDVVFAAKAAEALPAGIVTLAGAVRREVFDEIVIGVAAAAVPVRLTVQFEVFPDKTVGGVQERLLKVTVDDEEMDTFPFAVPIEGVRSPEPLLPTTLVTAIALDATLEELDVVAVITATMPSWIAVAFIP